jgi:uncharacterized damage-inducible protein DinB
MMRQAEQLMNDWMRHRRVLQEMLLLVGDEHMHFKPWDGAMPLAELTLHLVQWNEVFVKMVKTGDATPPDPIKCKTMADLRQAVAERTERTKAAFASLTDAELELKRVFSSGFEGTGKMFLTMMYDHEIHHKGQLFVYLRMCGVKELPFFRDYR